MFVLDSSELHHQDTQNQYIWVVQVQHNLMECALVWPHKMEGSNPSTAADCTVSAPNVTPGPERNPERTANEGDLGVGGWGKLHTLDWLPLTGYIPLETEVPMLEMSIVGMEHSYQHRAEDVWLCRCNLLEFVWLWSRDFS